MGKRAKFYLGYELNGAYTPLTILDNNLKLVDDSLTAVIDYTTSFDNEGLLRNAIINGPMNVDIPLGAKLIYLSSTNNPNYPYRKVLGLDHICYSLSKTLLDPSVQRNYFIDNKYDDNLYTQLYLTVLKSKIPMSEIYSILDDEERRIKDPKVIINAFKKHRNEITGGNNYILSFMDSVYNEILHAKEIGTTNYEYDPDRLDLEYIIRRLYDNLTIKKDKQNNNRHDPDTGAYLRDDKIIGYLTILISKDMEDKYKRYLREIEDQNEEEETVELRDVYRDYDGHDEEFLTTEDFEKYGEDPETNGYITRKSGI